MSNTSKLNANMTRKAMFIGRARPKELPDILALLERCGLVTTGLADHLEATLVARTGGRVVGSAALELYGASALLRSVAVEEALRGQGIGQRLTQQALALARRHGVVTVYLLTETAAGFYPRFGFRPIPREQVAPAVQRSVEFTSACPATAQAMELGLKNREETPMTNKATDPGAIREAVREHYGQVAKASAGKETCGSGSSSCCAP
ncbi:MAG: arsenic resistance N-acetyltransferase ArsN2, partial [Chloroflexota bacterium]|nr:arsenic resistance N-acetyltransferase ArsN2 [Chloroflexota bacterium]